MCILGYIDLARENASQLASCVPELKRHLSIENACKASDENRKRQGTHMVDIVGIQMLYVNIQFL